MKLEIITPASASSQRGNRITAERWLEILRSLGHDANIVENFGHPDLLIALHAKKSARVIASFRASQPDTPLVLCMTGTDLYGDILTDQEAQRSLELATKLVVLQERGIDALPAHVRHKAITIHQSCSAPARAEKIAPDRFVVIVVGHLRGVKDPFRAAEAARLAAPASKLLVVQIGAALEPAFAERAFEEMRTNPRYRWLGEVSRTRALELVAGSDLLALTSELEGGANAISEAIAAGIPVLSSRIDGSLGLLGADHPGYFPVHDTRALADLFERSERDPEFREALRARSFAKKHLIDPAREHEAWQKLLRELLP